MCIGIDIVKIERMKNLLTYSSAQAFLSRVYTAAELSEANSRSNKLFYYATRFARKEAVFKALRISSENIRLTEIEILSANCKCKLDTRMNKNCSAEAGLGCLGASTAGAVKDAAGKAEPLP